MNEISSQVNLNESSSHINTSSSLSSSKPIESSSSSDHLSSSTTITISSLTLIDTGYYYDTLHFFDEFGDTLEFHADDPYELFEPAMSTIDPVCQSVQDSLKKIAIPDNISYTSQLALSLERLSFLNQNCTTYVLSQLSYAPMIYGWKSSNYRGFQNSQPLIQFEETSIFEMNIHIEGQKTQAPNKVTRILHQNHVLPEITWENYEFILGNSIWDAPQPTSRHNLEQNYDYCKTIVLGQFLPLQENADNPFNVYQVYFELDSIGILRVCSFYDNGVADGIPIGIAYDQIYWGTELLLN